MQEEFEIELIHVAAGVAGAGRVDAHGAERMAEAAIDPLDGIERKLALRQVDVGQMGQRRVALQIGQDDRRLDLGKDALEQRVEDALRVLEFRAREEHGVAGDIGNQQKALLRHSLHSRDDDAKYGHSSRKLQRSRFDPAAGSRAAMRGAALPCGGEWVTITPAQTIKPKKRRGNA